MRVPARERRRWRALALMAVPGALLVTSTVQASPPTEPDEQPTVIEVAPVTAAPNLTPETVTAVATDDPSVIDGSYIVVMAADPVVAYEGGEPGLAPTAVAADETLDVEAPAVEAYVDHLEAEQDAALAAAGIADAAQGSTLHVRPERLPGRPHRGPGRGAAAPARRRLRDPEHDAPAGHRHLGALPRLVGAGRAVVVGHHRRGRGRRRHRHRHLARAPVRRRRRLVRRAGGLRRTCRASSATPRSTPPTPRSTCNNKLLGAYDFRDAYKTAVTPTTGPNAGRFPEPYNSARDYDGHGTHTATTAVGNAGVSATLYGIDRGVVSGIAPRARLIAYSVCGSAGCVESDLVAAIDQAVQDGVQVINYSIGSATPSVTGADDLAFLFAADANVWVATSNGNTGPGPGTGGSPSSAPWVTSVGASTHDRNFSSTARLGNGRLAVGVSITTGTGGTKPLVDAATLGNPLCLPNRPGVPVGSPAFSASVTGKIVLCFRGNNARVDKSRVVAGAGGAGMILYNINDVQALITDSHWVPSIHVNLTTGQAIKSYIASAGAAARASITDSKKVRSQGSVMADFSSRGPNRAAADIIKPDVTAPGVNILAGESPTPDLGDDAPGKPGELFQSISGTSMSSPHVAGLFALLREYHPDWTAAMAKSAVMTTARQNVVKENVSTPADPFDMGAGFVDPAGRPAAAGSMFSPGLVYNAELFDYYGFLCDVAPEVIIDFGTTCAAIAGGGYPTTARDLNLASIGVSNIVGSQTVQRTVTSVAAGTRTFVAEVEAPDGFDVTVEPSSIRLAPGESATYTVTLLRTDAPFNAWSFGALTWTSGGYEVRSPIAAQPTVFAAPDAVQGEGVDGTVTVPVRFGYTGAYTAGAHGPVPTTRTAGTVTQDPNQIFNPPIRPGTTAVPITVTGSAFLRIALNTADLTPPNPATDIDLYLYNSAGVRVGASGAGSTAELIEVVLPANGTYTLYVHGWSVPGGSTGFSLRSWSVPLTPGTGALTIESAPASAVTGADGEVVASWSGLAADDSYLGAVSHAGAGGELLGLTLVEIET